MNMDGSVFAVKLYEMEEQYGKLQCRIRICGQESKDKIHEELCRAQEEYKEHTLLLEEKVRLSRSEAVTRLLQAQLDYRKKIGEIKDREIVNDLCSDGTTSREAQDEADMLYAEFAIDFATLAMQQALISALAAMDRQKGQKGLQRENSEMKASGWNVTEKVTEYKRGEKAECRK